jgi:hypothetical protein
VPEEYHRWLKDRLRPLRRRYGLFGPGVAAEGARPSPSPWRVQPGGGTTTPDAALPAAVQPALF